MRLNVQTNEAEVQCHQLVWGEEEQIYKQFGLFSLILGADICYVEEALEPLWNTIDRLLSSDGSVWLAFTRRNVPIRSVLEHAARRRFVFQAPETEDGVYIFTRRGAKSWQKGCSPK
mmetsp:Transcript_507/g.688  ORF Transcript_507/g.688 Transcript_507/m.688 type:complete len:117 (+) Transcript_507:634-984(+)